jgi:hypothetical protein
MTPVLLALVAAAGVHFSSSLTSLRPSSFEGPGDGPAPAPGNVAPASVPAEVMVVHALNNETGIDPRIGKIPALSKPPFSAYNSYKLLSRTNVALPRGQVSPLSLPQGRTLRLVYREMQGARRPGAPPRYVLTASIQGKNGKAFLPSMEVNAKAHEWFWIGGQSYQGGTIFIAIKVNP